MSVKFLPVCLPCFLRAFLIIRTLRFILAKNHQGYVTLEPSCNLKNWIVIGKTWMIEWSSKNITIININYIIGTILNWNSSSKNDRSVTGTYCGTILNFAVQNYAADIGRSNPHVGLTGWTSLIYPMPAKNKSSQFGNSCSIQQAYLGQCFLSSKLPHICWIESWLDTTYLLVSEITNWYRKYPKIGYVKISTINHHQPLLA